MRLNIFILIPALTLVFCLSAKSQQVLSTTGSHVQNNQGMLSWTLGEPFITTLTSDENMLTQGFHQGKLTVTAIMEKNILPFSITAYPNPAIEILHLKIEPETSARLQYLLYSLHGQLLSESPISGSITEISFNDLKPGLYFVKILQDTREQKIFKVLKK
jgi:hypothetical protein